MTIRATKRRFRPELATFEDRLAPAIFTVNTFADEVAVTPADGSGLTASGKISLRSAVQASAFTTGADTINLQAGTYHLTLSGAEEDDGASGDLDIRSGTVTIQGAGMADTIVQAEFTTTGRVLQVNTAATATDATTVHLAGLTLTGGNVDQVNGFSGGGVQNEGGILTLDKVAVTGNKLTIAGGGDARGGGILSTAVGAFKGDVTLTDSVVSDNKVTGLDSSTNARGGGIYLSSAGTLTLVRTRVEGNTVTGASSVGTIGPGAGQGAGIYDEFGGVVTVTDSTIANNLALGGAASYDAQDAFGAFGQGGGIYTDFGTTLTVTGSTISGNTAQGGDARITASPPANVAQGGNGEGGGVYVRAAATVRNSTIAGNKAVGGAASGGTTNTTGFTVGGGISFTFVNSPTEVQTVTNSTVTKNEAAFGGGLASNNLAVGPTVESTIIAGNVGQDPDVESKFTSSGHNLVGIGQGSDSFRTDTGDQVGTMGSPISAGLAPLGNYGGPTQTFALLNGSPAINAGSIPTGVTLTTDQRGLPRVVGGQADVGAVEFASPVAANDTFTATAGVAMLVPAPGVLANDTDPMGGAGLTAVKLSDPAHGTLTFNADGSFTYTPQAAFKGTDAFTYQVLDKAGNASTAATVSVNVELPPPPPPNTPPTISDVTDQTSTGGAVGPLAFTVGDAETPVADLTVTATSSNAGLVPTGNIVFGGTGANRTVTLTPAAGQSGSSRITLTVRDANGATATDTFTVTVPPAGANTPPTISDVANQTIPKDGSVGPLAFTVGDAETAVTDLTVTVSSSNTTLLPLTGIVFGGSGANRTVTLTPAAGQTGTATVTLTVTDAGGMTAADTFTVSVPPAIPPIIPPGSPILAGGADGAVRLLTQASDGTFANGDTLTLFSGVGGSVRTAVGDVNGDGVADLVAGTGPGAATQVLVRDGKSGAILFQVRPFESSFTGGVYVAVADLNRDGKADVMIAPDEGGGPRVRIFSGAGFGQLADYLGIDDPNFRGGARVSAGDVNRDGVPDVVVAAGFLGGPRITIWDGTTVLNGAPHQLANFFAFETTLRNGAFVSAGDVTGDGVADLAFGGGPGGGPRIRIVDGAQLMAAGNFGTLDDPSVTKLTVANFFAGDTATRGGIRPALRDLDGDGKDDLIAGSGDAVQSAIRIYKATALAANPADPALAQAVIDPFGAVLANGVFVG